jgi:predicted AlkP superfamily pyrophosphatase or phosphodiesterase
MTAGRRWQETSTALLALQLGAGCNTSEAREAWAEWAEVPQADEAALAPEIGRAAQPLSVRREPTPSAQPLSAAARYARRLLARPIESRARLNLVFVLDGMRPDLIDAANTPTLQRLRSEGVDFINGHAVFPTVTRVNSPSIATGVYPERAGVVGNSIYVPELDPIAQVNTGDVNVLRELDRVSGGQLLLVPSLAERLHAAGKSLAAVSSGSSGSAYLLNHRAQAGIGSFVNGYLADPDGRVAYPDAVNTAILSRFGAAPPSDGDGGLIEPVNWAESVLRDYVLPELRPDVVLNWITQPDGAHHAFGAGSPEGTLAIANDDRNIGLILEQLTALGLHDVTNIFVVSDHGFGWDTQQVDVAGSLVVAGLKASPDQDDVVLAASSQALSIHVQDHDPERIRAIVRHLQAQAFTGVLFTRNDGSCSAAPHEGCVEGSFALDLIHLDNPERGADIVLTFDWTSDKNAFGVPGTDTRTGTSTGPRTGNESGHGSMSPWTVRNTWFAWGVDFKDGIVDRVPASNVDIAPTILALAGINPSDLDGRVLAEALEGGPDYEKLPIETQTLLTHTDGYAAALTVTQVAHQRYIDKSWRLR